MSDVFKFEYIEPQNIILNKNKEDRGIYIEGTKSGITLKTLQQPTDITIRSDFYAGNFDSVISVRNSYNTDQFFGSSINSTPEEQYIGDEFVLYRTGFAFTGSFSEGPFIRLGRNNIISEKSNSKLGIGTLFPAEKVHISGGNLRVEGNVFANNLYTKDNPSGFITGVDTSSLYPRSNPSGFITGVDLSSYVTKYSGAFTNRPTVNGTGVLLSGEAAELPTTIVYTTGNQTISGTKNFVTRPQVNNIGVVISGEAYPSNNPSGFITGVNLSSYVQIQQLNDLQPDEGGIIVSYAGGLWDPVSENIGFNVQDGDLIIRRNGSVIAGITPQDLTSNRTYFLPNSDGTIALTSNVNATGLALNQKIDNVSGNLQNKINSLSGAAILLYGNQTIDGTKTFRNSVYIHDLYVTGTEFIANVENNFIESPYILLNLTGGAIDGGIFFVTGVGLTGTNDYGPIIGFDHSNKFKFGIARRSDDLSVLNDIAAVQDIINYSGFVDNKYYTNNNPSGYITNQNVVFTTGNQDVDGTKIFSNKLIANSGIDIYFSGTAGTGVFVSGLWNNTGQTYVGIRYDVRLASGVVPSTTNSLANIRINNTGVFNINSKGQVLIQQLAGSPVYDNVFEVRRGGSSYFTIRDDGSIGVPSSNIFMGSTTTNSISLFSSFQPNVIVSRNGFFGISNSNDAGNYPVEHTVRLYRGGDFILDLRNATYPRSGHQFRVFNTTGTNSGEFGLFGWQRTGTTGTPNALVIGAQATQSGTLGDVIITGANININAFVTTNFNNRPTVNGTGVLLSGEAAQLPDTILYTTGNQIISGSKIFLTGVNISGNLVISGNTTITAHLAAATKSFLIPHPNDPSKKLQYGSLESPYHGIRLTDRAKIMDDSTTIELPKYISALVNDKKTNIQLTNINHSKVLFVKEVNVAQNYFVVGIDRGWFDKKEYEFYWSFTAERKDVPQLEVEF